MHKWINLVPQFNIVFQRDAPLSVLPVINKSRFKNVSVVLCLQKKFLSLLFGLSISVDEWRMPNSREIENLFLDFNVSKILFKESLFKA